MGKTIALLRYNPHQEDTDGDGVGDACDSCPTDTNPGNKDIDGDTIGDACDNCIDKDWDGFGDPGFPNSCDEDNCPALFNPGQEDEDRDGSGDVCDEDDDNDGCEDTIDPSPRTHSPDKDGDGRGADCDNCPDIPNPDQKDTYPPQGNGIGDACDCEGDFNCDGSVDTADYSLFFKDFNQRNRLDNPCTKDNQCNGDFDCDGDVDGDDRALFQADFGRGQYTNPCPDCVAGDWCKQ